MAVRFLVLSVEHSGTRFVKNTLLRGHSRAYHHLVPKHRQFISQLRDKHEFVLVPLRHPMEIARSWARRGMNLGHLALRFDMLRTMFEVKEPLWIPVDIEERDEYVEKAIKATGAKLTPAGWPRVGHERANEDYMMTEDEISTIMPAVERNLDFFERFYPNPMEVGSGTLDKQSSAA